MSGISIADVARLHFEGAIDKSEALARAQRLGLDHIQLSMLLGDEPQRPMSRAEAEATQEPVWRVTAHGFPKEDGRGKPYPFIWAGRHSWVRDPKGSSTHELTETQWRDMERKVAKGVIAVVKKERMKAPEAEPRKK